MKAILIYFYVFFMLFILSPVIFFRYFYYVVLSNQRDYNKLYKLNNLVFSGALKLVGSKVEIVGYEHLKDLDNGFLVVSNHQSYFDIPLISLLFKEFGISFVSKKSIKNVFILGQYMQVISCLFLDRSSVKAGMQMIKDGGKLIKSGVNVAIFPEGTRSSTGEVADFKAGSLKIATRVDAPIVPVSISGSFDLNSSFFKMKQANVKLTIHPPVLKADYDELKPQVLCDVLENTVKSQVRI